MDTNRAPARCGIRHPAAYSLSVGPPLWSRRKYLKYLMDGHEIFQRYVLTFFLSAAYPGLYTEMRPIVGEWSLSAWQDVPLVLPALIFTCDPRPSATQSLIERSQRGCRFRCPVIKRALPSGTICQLFMQDLSLSLALRVRFPQAPPAARLCRYSRNVSILQGNSSNQLLS